MENERAELFERFAEKGTAGLSDTELLELILYYSGIRTGVHERAEKLLDHFRTLNELLCSDIPALRQAGLTDSAAVLIRMIYDMYPEYAVMNISEGGELSTAMLKDMFRSYYLGKNVEETRAACFDKKGRLIVVKRLSVGDSYSARVDMRKFVTLLLSTGASAVALAHNHPHTGVQPSDKDLAVTELAYIEAVGIGVEFLDHIIVGEKDTFSFRENGMLKYNW